MADLISTTFDHKFYPGDMVGLTFLTALQAAEGAATYGNTTAVGEFAQATDATNATMRSEATAFWTTGVPDAGSTTAKTGLSSTTPFEFFEAFRSSAAAAGTWRYADGAGQTGTTVTGLNWAKGLRALPTFTGVWDYLVAFTSNSTYETADDTAPQAVAAALTGTYDPTLALATTLIVSGTNASKNGSSRYDWATTGLMAEIQTTRGASGLGNAKAEVARPRRRYVDPTPRASRTDWLGLRGQSGLDFQVSFTDTVEGASRQVIDVLRAAMLMNAYRYTPQTWNLPDLT